MGLRLCVSRRPAGGPVATPWDPLMWTILPKKKVRLRETKWLVQSPAANTGWDWGENPGLPAVKLSSLICSCRSLKKFPATEADLLSCNAGCPVRMEMGTGQQESSWMIPSPGPQVLPNMKSLQQPWLEEKSCLKRLKGPDRPDRVLRKLYLQRLVRWVWPVGQRWRTPILRGGTLFDLLFTVV